MFGSQKSGFGSAGFGSSSTFGGSSGGSLFGSNTQTSQSNSLFGNTANNTNNTGGGSMFGNNTGNNSGGFSFGNNQTQNNQQNNQQQQSNTGGLFGNTTSASTGGLFGGGNASNFGSSGSTFGANTGGTNLFGNNTNQTNTSNTSTGLFGNNQAANTFGGNNQTQFSAGGGNGTEQKFEPKLSKDSNPKGGTDINTRLLCYSAMNNYTAKSLEELRIEDYVATRKGPTAGSNSLFGNTGSTTGTTGGIFGNTSTNTSFGGGNTLFGNNSATQNTTSNTNLFGNNTNTSQTGGGGLFGNKAQANTFGTAGTGTSFGNTNTSNNLFGNTQAQGSNSLFGNNSTSTTGSLFGNTNTNSGVNTNNANTSLFGNTNTSNSLFGNKNAGSTTGNLFGNTNTGNTNTNTGSLFNTNTAQTGNTGSIFGNNTNKSGGGFGSSFGTNANNNTSLFGNNQNKTSGTGTFGFPNNTNNAAGSTSLFGNTGANTGGTNLFGNNQAAGNTGGLFGNTQNKPLFGNTNTGGGLFSNTNTNQNQQAAAPAQNVNLDATIQQLIQNPYGDSPLFRNATVDKAKMAEQLQPVSPSAQKAALQPQYKVTTNPSRSILKTQVKSPNRSLFIGLEEDTESSFNSSSLRPKQSVKKLTVKVSASRRTSESILFNKTRDSVGDSLPTTPRNNGRIPFNQLDDSTSGLDGLESTPNGPQTPDLNGHGGLQNPVEPLLLDSVRKDFKDRLDESSFLDSNRSTPVEFDTETVAEPHPAGIKLSRPDYESKPPLSELGELDEGGQCWVKGFTIVRKNYGQIFWPGRIDLANLNLDRIVEIKRKAVSVYPDEIEDQKPEQGTGLNQRAEISLTYTFPREKGSNEIIRDPSRLERMGWPAKLERATEKIGGRFLDYDLQTGTWSFSVQHFSKYELAESDDEIDENEEVDRLKTLQKIPSLPVPKLRSTTPARASPLLESNTIQQPELAGLGGGLGGVTGEEDEKSTEANLIPTNQSYSRQTVNSLPTADTLLGCQKIQEMKYSLFSDEMMVDETQVEGESGGPLNQSTRMPEAHSQSLLFDPQRLSIFSPKPELKLSSLFSQKKKLDVSINQSSPFSRQVSTIQSVTKRTRCELGPVPIEEQSWTTKIAALDRLNHTVLKNSKWRTGWGNSGQFVHGGVTVTAETSKSETGGILSATSAKPRGFRANLRKIKLTQPLSEGDKEHIHKLFTTFIQHATISTSSDTTLPHIEIEKSKSQNFINAVNGLAKYESENRTCNFNTIQYEVTSLVCALWSDLPLRGNSALNSRERKKQLSKWLSQTVQKAVESESETEMSAGNRIYTLLSTNNVRQAIKVAQENDLHKLSLLIPLAGNERVQGMLQKQLQEWKQSKMDSTFDSDLFKIYQMLCGSNIENNSTGPVNVLNGLDWRRALGFFLWYGTTNADSISGALEMYEKCFLSGTASYPLTLSQQLSIPEGVDDFFPSSDIYDILYLILKLYKNSIEPLNKLLVPDSYGECSIDYRLPWLTFILLNALDYTTDLMSEQILYTSFASQLESAGLWHYSIVVAMMNSDSASREKCVKEILLRNVRIEQDEQSQLLETFLTEEIGIPIIWIHEAKASEALKWKNYKEAVNYLIDANCFDSAHKLIVSELASNCIVNGEVQYLKNLFERLSNDGVSDQIERWEIEGAVYLEYFNAQFLVKDMKEKIDECESVDDLMVQLEEIGPQLASLVVKIGGLPSEKAIDSLARAELARGSLRLWETRTAILEKQEDIEQLENLVRAARLPEDYALESLRRASMRVISS